MTHSNDPTLQRAITAALAALDVAPDGWLPLAARRQLRLEAFGPWTPWKHADWPNRGSLRRAELYAACARRALPIFEAAYPGDRRARQLIAMTLAALRNQAPEEPVSQLFQEFRLTVEPLGSQLDRARVFFAGEAALACYWASFDGDLELEFHPPDDQDTDLDEHWPDALAGWALAWEDPDGYRDYWGWYITEAVPAARAAVPVGEELL